MTLICLRNAAVPSSSLCCLPLASSSFRSSSVYCAAFAIGAEVEVVYFVIFVPILTFLLALPLSIGGFGMREVSLVYFFRSVGLSAERGLTVSFLVSLRVVLANLPGAWLCSGIFSQKLS